MSFEEEFNSYLDETSRAIKSLKDISSQIESASLLMCETLLSSRTIYWCGNGGSAAEAQHMSAELVGRFEVEGRALSSMSLTTDTSAITAIGNDYGFDYIFSRQLAALGNEGDLLIGFSTSGSSMNVLEAFKQAKLLNMSSILFTGSNFSQLSNLSSVVINVPSGRTSITQESHLILGHFLCSKVEQKIRNAN